MCVQTCGAALRGGDLAARALPKSRPAAASDLQVRFSHDLIFPSALGGRPLLTDADTATTCALNDAIRGVGCLVVLPCCDSLHIFIRCSVPRARTTASRHWCKSQVTPCSLPRAKTLARSLCSSIRPQLDLIAPLFREPTYALIPQTLPCTEPPASSASQLCQLTTTHSLAHDPRSE